MAKRLSLLATLIFLLLVSVVAKAEEQVQAAVFKEGDFWKFKIVEKPVPGFSSTAIQFLNGIFTLRHTARGRMWVQELVEDKEILLESDQYIGRILSLLGLRQTGSPEGPPTTFNILLPFPLYVGKQWRNSYKTRVRTLSVPNTVNSEVVAEQQVATQAANFRALKIERTHQIPVASPVFGSHMLNTRGAYYYSPETKSIVKYDFVGDNGYDLQIELLEFVPAH